nr:RICIN domain-containing protein [Archangium lipolyticum]
MRPRGTFLNQPSSSRREVRASPTRGLRGLSRRGQARGTSHASLGHNRALCWHDPPALHIQFPCHGRGNQRFRLEVLGDGFFGLRARHSGQCLDVGSASKV